MPETGTAPEEDADDEKDDENGDAASDRRSVDGDAGVVRDANTVSKCILLATAVAGAWMPNCAA
jgi:hypothetical protein